MANNYKIRKPTSKPESGVLYNSIIMCCLCPNPKKLVSSLGPKIKVFDMSPILTNDAQPGTLNEPGSKIHFWAD